MRIGPVAYSKKEEDLFFKCYGLGLFAELPFAFVLFSLFPPPIRSPSDFVGWFLLLYQVAGRLLIPWFCLTAAASAVQFRRNGLIRSTSDVLRLIWALFFVFPFLFTYVFLISAAIFVPIYERAIWLDLVRRYWFCMLLFLPFLFLFFLTFMPDLPPRRMVGRAALVLEGKAAFPKIRFLPAIEAVFLAIYLLVVFLPLPNPYGAVDIFTIGGGVVGITILYKDRIKRRIRRKR